MIAAVKYAMFAFVSYLVRYINASIAKNATGHMQLDEWTKIHSVECSPFKFVTCTFFAMLVAEILQVTFSCLIADGTIKRVIDQQKFNNPFSRIDHFFAGDILNNHSVHHIRA